MSRKTKLSRLARRRLAIYGPVAFVLVVAAWLVHSLSTAPVDSFLACSNAGYPVTDSNPAVCQSDVGSFTGPLKSPVPTATEIVNQPTELLVDADSHGDYARGWQVITSQAQWQAFWSAVHEAVSLPPIIPVDFSTSDVVALSEGREPTTGYKVEVTGISSSAAGTTIDLTESAPEKCVEAQHVTNPYYLVQTAKLPAPVNFVLTHTTHTCS